MTRLALLAPLIVAAALRLHGIGLPVLTSDEAFSWRLIRYPVPEMLRRAALDVHPPLYYFALDAWAALAGSSPAAIRGLSALLGVLAVAMAYAVCIETLRSAGADGRRARLGALLAAGAMAIQAAPIGHGRNARMYALAIVLGAATCWLLLRALRPGERRWGWWAAYGVAVAAFCATHYYAAFTVAAQVVFVAFIWQPLPGERRPALRRAAAALALAALLSSPWLPVIARQAEQVRQAYWIPPVSVGALGTALVHWAVGAEMAIGAAWAWLIALGALLAWGWLRGGVAARLLLLQALLPWALGLAVSAAAGRPVVLERYMAFGQFFLICLWGVLWARIASGAMRAMAAVLLAVVSVIGTAATWSARYPDRPPAFFYAARYLKRQAGAGDLVLLRSPRALNKLRAYGELADADRLDIRFVPAPATQDDHYSHLPSLDQGDLLHADPFLDHAPRTIWRVEDVRTAPEPAPPGWAITHARLFEGGDAPVVLIAGYGRSSAPAGGAPALGEQRE